MWDICFTGAIWEGIQKVWVAVAFFIFFFNEHDVYEYHVIITLMYDVWSDSQEKMVGALLSLEASLASGSSCNKLGTGTGSIFSFVPFTMLLLLDS